MKDTEEPFPDLATRRGRRKHKRSRIFKLIRRIVFLLALSGAAAYLFSAAHWLEWLDPLLPSPSPHVLKHRHKLLEQCKAIQTPAGPPKHYRPESRIAKPHERKHGKKGKGSDRFVPGTPPTLIKNAKIWTGTHNGTYIIHGDILVDQGLVIAVGHVPAHLIDKYIPKHSKERKEMVVLDAHDKWVTPGLVDLHSHIGVSSAPEMDGMCVPSMFGLASFLTLSSDSRCSR